MNSRLVTKSDLQQEHQQLNILVVDDDDSIRKMLSMVLTGEGHSVTTAHDGRHGLDEFRSAKFDVVITDLDMPEMSGEEMAKRMAQNTLVRPAVIMLTGSIEADRLAESEMVGVDFIIDKPVSTTRLLDVISEAAQTDTLTGRG